MASTTRKPEPAAGREHGVAVAGTHPRRGTRADPAGLPVEDYVAHPMQPDRPAPRPTARAAPAAVRHRIRTSTTSALSPDDADVTKGPRTYLDRLVQAARYPTWNGQRRA